MNKRITLQSVDDDTPVLGEVTEAATGAGTRWAKRQSLSSRELFISDQRFADSTWLFTMRYDSLTSTITPEWNIVDGSETFDIQGAFDPDGRKREIHVACTLAE